jgi:fatty-acid desaturase
VQNVLEFKQKHRKFNWDSIIPIVIFHLLAVWALFTFSWANLIAAVVMWWVAGSLGIGLGYHRMLTHGGFKTPKWLEYFLTFCGTLALQSGAIKWVTTHRLHHAHTETRPATELTGRTSAGFFAARRRNTAKQLSINMCRT